MAEDKTVGDDKSVADKAVIDKILEAVTGFGDQLVAMGNRLVTLEARHDSQEKQDAARRDAQIRADAFKGFSRRKHDDNDESYTKRHDQEECSLLERLLALGEPREMAADRAKRGRRDAETAEKDAAAFSDDRSKRDAEEKSLAERFEKEGEKKEDAARRASFARGRRDDADTDREKEEEEERKMKDRLEKEGKDDSKKDSQPIDMDKIQKSVLDFVRGEQRKNEMSDEDKTKVAAAQAEFDNVAQAFGDHAPRPLQGELLREYTIRFLNKIKKHSSAWDKIDLNTLPMDALNVAKDSIFRDAHTASRNPTVEGGVLVERSRQDVTGRKITEFFGEPLSWMEQFMPPRRAVSRLNTPSSDRR